MQISMNSKQCWSLAYRIIFHPEEKDQGVHEFGWSDLYQSK